MKNDNYNKKKKKDKKIKSKKLLSINFHMLLMMTKDRRISSNKYSIIYNEYKRKNRRGVVEYIVQNKKELNPRREKNNIY